MSLSDVGWSSPSSSDSTAHSESESSDTSARSECESATSPVYSESESTSDSDSDRSFFKDVEWSRKAAALQRKKTALLKKINNVKNPIIIPFAQDKCHGSPPKLSVNYFMLNDHEIDEDIKAIQSLASSSITKTSSKKKKVLKTTRDEDDSMKISENPKSSVDNIKSIRIEKGKLLFKNNWYGRGDRVCVGGDQMSDFFGVISNIGFESICVKTPKKQNCLRMCIKLSLLIKGKVWLKPQVAP